MDENLVKKLDDEIIRIEDKLKTLPVGSEEYIKVSGLLKGLYHERVEHTKAEWDYDEKREKRLYDSGRTDEDLRLREEEVIAQRDRNKNERLFNLIRLAVDVVKIVGGSVLFVLLCLAGFKFEEKGVVSSKFFGKIIDLAFRKLGR